MFSRILLLTVALVMVADSLAAAEWTFAENEWTKAASEHAGANFTFIPGEATIEAKRGRSIRLERRLDLDGDDEEPLVVSCALAAQGDRVLAKAPLVLGLRWPDALVTVGAFEIKPNTRNGIARWSLSGKTEQVLDRTELDPGAFFNYARILLTKRDVSLSVSEDGLIWRRITALPRTGPLEGRPMQVVFGAGWGGTDGLDPMQDSEPMAGTADAAPVCVYRLAQISAHRIGRHIPPALLATYNRGESREDTREKLLAQSFPKTWYIAGPFAPKRNVVTYGPEAADFDPGKPCVVDGASGSWREQSIGAEFHQRIMLISRSDNNENKGKVFFAATVIDCLQDERVRLLYDGLQSAALFVNGRPISHDKQAQRRSVVAEMDRLSAVADLRKGRNIVMLRLMARDNNGACAFILRREPGDPRYRIALERRLAIDFPGDIEEIADGLREAARAWEDLGHLRGAIDQLGELLEVEDLDAAHREEALLDRARLRARLRDQEAVVQDVEAVQVFWTDSGGADRATVLRRSADLWHRLGQSDRALEELGKAVAIADLAMPRRMELELERLRLLIQLDRAGEIAADEKALAALLPEDVPERSFLLASSAMISRDVELRKELVGTRLPRAIRVGIGLANLANDPTTAIQGWEKLATQKSLGGFDDPLVGLAETQAAAGNDKAALATYGKALAALGLKPASDLAGCRTAYLRARLEANPAGKELLAAKASAQAGSFSALAITDWKVIGPYPDSDFRTYKAPPIKVDTTTGSGSEGKGKDAKDWIASTVEHYRDGEILDFKRLFNVDNHVAFCYRLIDAPEQMKAQLSMGADDGLVVWLNGKKVHEDTTQRGVTPDSIQIPIQLNKGSNRLVVLVQNGNGDWGLQARVIVAEMVDHDLAQTVQKAVKMTDDRQLAAKSLTAAASIAWRFGRVDAYASIIEAACASFPDQAAEIIPQLRVLCDGNQARRLPETTTAAMRWWDARDATHLLASDDASVRMAEMRLWAGVILGELGHIVEGSELVESALWTTGDLRIHLQALRSLGDLMRYAGDPQAAARLYEKVTAVEGDIHGLQRQAREALASVRRIRMEVKPVTASLDATTALQSAERAAANDDLEHAQKAFQEAIVVGAGEVIGQEDGSYVGIAWWCTQRLRSLPAELMNSYTERFGRDAHQALVAALAADDIDVLERVAARWPIAPSAGTALVEAAARYRAAGADVLARATAEMAAKYFGFTGPTAERLSALKEIRPRHDSPALPQALLGHLAAAIPADALHDLRRLINEGGKTVHIVAGPAISGDTAVLHTGVEVVAMDLGTGRERWRRPAVAVGAANVTAFAGMPVHGAVVIDHVVIGRSVSGTTALIEGRSLDDGSLLWTTAWRRDLNNFIPVAAPASDGIRCIVLGLDGERGVAMALRPRDGAVLWRTALPMAIHDLGVANEEAVFPIGHVSGAPVIEGRDCLISLDSGGMACLDAPSGVVRWVAAYPRAVYNARGSAGIIAAQLERVPGSIVVGTDTVLLLPRDHSGIYAFNRVDGKLRWSHPVARARAVAGLVRVDGGEYAILHGDEVQALDLATGIERWSWRGDGPTIGIGSADPQGVMVSTVSSMVRLDAATGKALGSTSWRTMGIVGTPPGILAAYKDRVVGGGNAGLSLLGPGQAPAKPVPLIPSPRKSAGVLPATSAKPDGGKPLSIAWQLANVEVVAFPVPIDPLAGETFVRLRNGLALIDTEKGDLRWRVDLPSDVRHMSIAGPGILTVNDGTMGYYTRSTGSPRWILPIRESVTDRLYEPWRLRCSLGENLAITYALSQDWVVVRDAKNGSILLRDAQRGLGLAWAGEIAGSLVLIYFKEEKEIQIHSRSISDVSTISEVKKFPFAVKDSTITDVPGSSAVLIMGSQAGWLDLAKRDLQPIKIEKSWVANMRVVDDELHIIGREGNKIYFHRLSAKDGSVRFSQRTHEGWMGNWEWNRYGYGGTKDLMVRALAKDKKIKLHGIDGQGKEVFETTQGNPWDITHIAFAGLNGRVHGLADRGGRLLSQLIAADGSIEAEAPLPFALPQDRLSMLIVGDSWLVGTRSGLVALRPHAVVPAGATALPQLAVQARAGLPPVELLKPVQMAVPPMIDGHLDDWSDVAALEAGVHSFRDLGGNNAPTALTAHIAWTTSGIVVAARVGDATRREFGVGVPATQTDGLVLAIDPRDEGRDGQTLFVHVGVRNGCSEVRLGGMIADDAMGEVAVQGRAARGDGETRYEILVPWALLRRNEAHRPGDKPWMRLGIAAVDGDGDRGGARELGFDVAEMGASPWWLPLEIRPAK